MKYLAACLLILICACQKQNLRNAEESLEGTWNVTEAYSEEKDNSGVNGDGRHWEDGDLGTFTFSKSTVTYSYLRLDSTYAETTDWELTREKEKQGFHKVEKYTLRIGSRNYQCAFGDQTSDAEKVARNVLLSFETTNTEPNYVLTLVKQ